MFKRRRALLKTVVILSSLCWCKAGAQSALPIENSAIAFAKLFWTEFDSETPSQIYNRRMSPYFKSVNLEAAFAKQVQILRSQVGGPGVDRTFVGIQPVPELTVGVRRDLSLVRLRARFPNGYAFQDIYIRPIGSEWVVDYLVLSQAPSPEQ